MLEEWHQGVSSSGEKDKTNPRSVGSSPTISNEHQEYLQRVSNKGLISSEVAATAWDLWLEVQKAEPSMPVPSAATGPDGVMFYSWDKEEHHLEIEIFPDKNEFFYRNRETKTTWMETGEFLPDEFLEKLSFFKEKL